VPSVNAVFAKIETMRNFRRKRMAERDRIRVRKDVAGAVGRILSGTFGPQTAFVLSEAKSIVNDSGRRAGKTDGWAARFYVRGMRPEEAGGLSVFITGSAATSEELLGTALKGMNDRYRLGLTRREREGQIYYMLPNSHRIWLAGCKDTAEVGKFRGYKFRRAVVDESQNITRILGKLVTESLEPALMDFDGELGLSGTPNVQCVGDWYDFCHNEQFEHHHWTVFENPYIKNAKKFVERIKVRYKWTDTTPRYMREYLGLWCNDTESLCYPFNRELNWIPELPAGKWRYSIGVDFGAREPCAWVVCAYRHDHPKLYLVHCEQAAELSPSKSALKTMELMARFDTNDVVVDSGGAGAAFLKEWGDRYRLFPEVAKKTDVSGQIAIMAGELQSGDIVLVGECMKPLEDEWAILPWADDMSGHFPRFEDHLSDAARYVVRHVRPGVALPDDEPERERDPEREEILKRQANVARLLGRG